MPKVFRKKILLRSCFRIYDMKKVVLFCFLLSTVLVFSQDEKKLTFDSLKPFLIDFLYDKNQLSVERVDKLKSGEFDFNLSGVFNNKRDGVLINGIYAFSNFSSHSKSFFVL